MSPTLQLFIYVIYKGAISFLYKVSFLYEILSPPQQFVRLRIIQRGDFVSIQSVPFYENISPCYSSFAYVLYQGAILFWYKVSPSMKYCLPQWFYFEKGRQYHRETLLRDTGVRNGIIPWIYYDRCLGFGGGGVSGGCSNYAVNEWVHTLGVSVEIECKMDWQGCKQV